MRINGRQYAFQWNAELNAYAWEAPNIEAVNTLLKDNDGARMFVPGIILVEDGAVKAPTKAKAPQKEEAPAALKVIVEPEPVAPVADESKKTSPEPEAAPKKGKATSRKSK